MYMYMILCQFPVEEQCILCALSLFTVQVSIEIAMCSKYKTFLCRKYPKLLTLMHMFKKIAFKKKKKLM